MNTGIRLATVLVIVAGAVSAANRKLADDLTSDTPRVIVQFKNAPRAEHHARMARRGAILHRELSLINAAAYSVRAESLGDLVSDPEVEYISPDRTVTGSLDYAEPTTNALIAFQNKYDGTGVGIAVIDSGISNHDDLKNANGALRVVYSQDFVGGGTDDHYGHGQHVAGVLAGNAKDSTGSQYTRSFRGIAPNANLINLRVLDQNGSGSDSGVIAAIQQAIALKKKYNIHIINLSLGRPVYESYKVDPLCKAVEQAWNAGIIVAAAAGNSGRNNSVGTNGYATITAPGNDPLVITVGAMKDQRTLTRNDDTVASYSSKGPTLIDHVVKPDLVAPGNRIISLLASTSHFANTYPTNAIPKNYYISGNDTSLSNNYYTLSGTSMAAPMVSGRGRIVASKGPVAHA